jgi:hypothetical protein
MRIREQRVYKNNFPIKKETRNINKTIKHRKKTLAKTLESGISDKDLVLS